MVHDLALQIAAASPRYVSPEDVPAEAIEAEKNIYRAQLAEDKKPDNIKERIIDGKLKKWYGEVALIEQPFVKDNDLTIAQLLEKKLAEYTDTASADHELPKLATAKDQEAREKREAHLALLKDDEVGSWRKGLLNLLLDEDCYEPTSSSLSRAR